MVLAVLILTWCVVFALWWYMKLRRPSPPVYPGALPVIGHGHLLLADGSHLWQVEQKAHHFCLENKDLIELRFGPRSVYVITDLEDCLTVANTCLDKPYIYEFGKQLYDRGLISSAAPIWKAHRKVLNPAFNQQILNTYVQEYSAQARLLVAELAAEAGKDPFDVVPYLLDNLLRAVYRRETHRTDQCGDAWGRPMSSSGRLSAEMMMIFLGLVSSLFF